MGTGKGWRELPVLVLSRQPTDLILTLYIKSVLMEPNTTQLFLSAGNGGPCPSPSFLFLPISQPYLTPGFVCAESKCLGSERAPVLPEEGLWEGQGVLRANHQFYGGC